MKSILLSTIALFASIAPMFPANASCDFASVREQGDSFYYEPARPHPIRLSPAQAASSFVYLRAEDPQAQINLRRYASINAPIVGHGRVGDRVWVSGVRTDDNGSYWYKVGYEGTAIVGWVREDLITR